MTDWAREAGGQKRLERERQAQQQKVQAEAKQRETNVYTRHIDGVIETVETQVRAAVDAYRSATGDDIKVTGDPAGGLLIEKTAYPAGYMSIKLDRDRRQLTFSSEFSQHAGNRNTGSSATAQLIVEGEQILIASGSRHYQPADFVRELLAPYFRKL